MAGDLDAALTLLRTNGYKATPPTLRRMATKPRELVKNVTQIQKVICLRYDSNMFANHPPLSINTKRVLKRGRWIIDRTNLQKPLYWGLIAAKLLENFESLVFGNAHLLTV